ncbi:alpha/beta fold hydrolase [Sneathiella sp. P13V-1]|uniref:alpha/beta fold hydrolase n=1 Tax=Sneathiella sp. P13V-1 TaxID=2697366 RepID=UPI00187B5DBC|nr:alpha/beta fold hydrolase [Sneathiella sp. P13V-1]MBE7636006.1 alpha/beta fold hydrolase [Sneathiella sp. P13V-1]
MKIEAGELTFEVDRQGDPAAPTVILIAGLGFQLIDWHQNFCSPLVDAGFQVIRFDNRDVGLSDKLEEGGVPDLAAVMGAKLSGTFPDTPFTLEDMAADVSNILSALDISAAHIVGMSMGGMIAQLFALNYPEKTLSLTSIMSSSSEIDLPGPNEAAAAILASAPLSQEMADIVRFGLEVNDVIGSPGFRWDASELEAHIKACVSRCYCPTGYMRQYAAVMAAPGRRQRLKSLTTPTLVIHGSEDPLVQAPCGQDVSNSIPGAQYVEVAGMGHDLSPLLCSRLAELVLPHVRGNS